MPCLGTLAWCPLPASHAGVSTALLCSPCCGGVHDCGWCRCWSGLPDHPAGRRLPYFVYPARPQRRPVTLAPWRRAAIGKMAGLSSQEGSDAARTVASPAVNPACPARRPDAAVDAGQRSAFATGSAPAAATSEAAEMVDLRMFVRGLADTCASGRRFRAGRTGAGARHHCARPAERSSVPTRHRAQALGEARSRHWRRRCRIGHTAGTPEKASMTVAASAPASAPRVFPGRFRAGAGEVPVAAARRPGYAPNLRRLGCAGAHAMASRQPAALIADIDAPHGVFGGAIRSASCVAPASRSPVLFLSARADSRTADRVARRRRRLLRQAGRRAGTATKLGELISHQEPAPVSRRHGR